MKNALNFHEVMKNKTDKEYLELLCRAEHEDEINGVKMPGFPSVEIQTQFVGSSGATTLKGEAWTFYKLIKSNVKTYNPMGINSETKILDFGCGWGRIVRFFFKDVKSENVFGIDVDADIIEICKNTLPYGDFSVCNPLSPVKFQEDSFDIIFAYSVFSHLRSDVASNWVQEFARILKPGGLLIATTRGEWFLNHLKYLQKLRNEGGLNEHQKIIMKCFSPIEESFERYKKGEFLYEPTGGGGPRDSSFYGEAAIPREYVESEFGKFLKFKSFADDTSLSQSVFVMQK